MLVELCSCPPCVAVPLLVVVPLFRLAMRGLCGLPWAPRGLRSGSSWVLCPCCARLLWWLCWLCLSGLLLCSAMAVAFVYRVVVVPGIGLFWIGVHPLGDPSSQNFGPAQPVGRRQNLQRLRMRTVCAPAKLTHPGHAISREPPSPCPPPDFPFRGDNKHGIYSVVFSLGKKNGTLSWFLSLLESALCPTRIRSAGAGATFEMGRVERLRRRFNLFLTYEAQFFYRVSLSAPIPWRSFRFAMMSGLYVARYGI